MRVPFPLARFLARSGVARWLPAVRRQLGATGRVLHQLSDRMLTTSLAQVTDHCRLMEGLHATAIDLSADPGRPATSRAFLGPEKAAAVIAERHSAALGISFCPHEVLLTHGARGAMAAIADAFINAGDRAVVFDPTAPLFADAIQFRRGHLRSVHVDQQAGIIRCDVDELRKALAGAKLLAVCEPNNPTGGRLDPLVVDAIARWAVRYDVLVVWDRTFASDPTPLAPAFERLRGRLLIIDRVGAGVGSLTADTALLAPCGFAAARLAAPVLQAALPENLGERVEIRHYVSDRLTECGFQPWPGVEGPFIWASVAGFGMSGRQFCERLAEAEDVWLAPGDRFGPSGRDYVRVTMTFDEGRLREGLRRIAAFTAQNTARSVAHVGEMNVA